MGGGVCEIIADFDQVFVEEGKGEAGMLLMDLYQTIRDCDGRCRQVSGLEALLNWGRHKAASPSN
jgi:hypothetical protein